MGDGVGADEQLERAEAFGDARGGGGACRRAGLALGPLGRGLHRGDGKRAGAAGRVEEAHLRVAQPVGAQALAQRGVGAGDDELHQLGRGVIDAVLLPRPAVVGGEEVLVEIQDRVAPVAAGREAFGRDGVDRVAQHVEGGTERVQYLLHRQRSQRGPEQRAARQVAVRALRDLGAAGRLAREEQAEGESLGEGVGEERVRVIALAPAGARLGEQRLLELGADVAERFGQLGLGDVLHRVAGQARGEGERAGGVERGLDRRRRGGGEGAEDRHEPRQVVRARHALGRRVGGRGEVQRGRGHHDRLRLEDGLRGGAAADQLDRVEVAPAPHRQRGKALELPPVVRRAAAGQQRMAGDFQLQEGAGGLAGPREGEVGSTDAALGELGQHGGRGGHVLAQRRLDQPVEQGREEEFQRGALAPGLGLVGAAGLAGLADEAHQGGAGLCHRGAA